MASINALKFVKKRLDHGDVYTFYFSLPKSLNHKAGQHGLFILPGMYRPHPFSLSSSPDEKYVAITTHVHTGSRYKKRLMGMKKGSSIILLGPMLNFTFRAQSNNHVFLAQGVGITPFRSMLVQAHTNSLPVTTTLIHVDSQEHTFRAITQQCASNAHYPSNPDEFRECVANQPVEQMFYISGSPRFVRATRELLLEQGVKKSDITTDSFLGY